MIKPKKICLDASTVCQLKCPSCPTASGETGKKLGRGFLRFSDFREIVDKNPQLYSIELSNWGEIFLNKELAKIIEYAYIHNIALTASNGTNINNADEDILEALVKYKFRKITCSIDGACQKTYSIYRINGNFDIVIDNIEKINRFKNQYNSFFPVLDWQFVIFGHNVHDINNARKMAKELNMIFITKLSWDDLYIKSFPTITNADLIRQESGLGVASREEYREKYKREYQSKSCLKLWISPQINYDGRLLGCSVNYWDDYGNILKEGLNVCINNEKVNYAKAMLMGKQEEKDDIPCSHCKFYKWRKEKRNWINDKDIKDTQAGSRTLVMLENKLLSYKFRNKLAEMAVAAKLFKKKIYNIMKRNFKLKLGIVLISQVQTLRLPLKFFKNEKWKRFPIFNGVTEGLSKLSCHASSLSFNHSPHIPHSHKEEELLLLLSGSIDIILPGGISTGKNQCIHLEKGQFLYYPSYLTHTLQTTSVKPANYLMFRWYTNLKKSSTTPVLSFNCFNMLEQNINSDKKGSKNSFYKNLIFEGPTSYLQKLHCHISVLLPGTGYKPHSDTYDVSLIVLEGEIETLGQSAKPYDVIFYAAGEPHGIYNPGTTIARYIVFEFHQYYKMSINRFFNISGYVFTKVTDIKRWKRKIRQILSLLHNFKIKLF